MAETAAEKRQHYRFAMSYPVKLFGRSGRQLTTGQTVNLSRSGALLSVSRDIVDELLASDGVNVTISLPAKSYRADSTTGFACNARIVRQCRLDDGAAGEVAVEFSRPMQLAN